MCRGGGLINTLRGSIRKLRGELLVITIGTIKAKEGEEMDPKGKT